MINAITVLIRYEILLHLHQQLAATSWPFARTARDERVVDAAATADTPPHENIYHDLKT